MPAVHNVNGSIKLTQTAKKNRQKYLKQNSTIFNFECNSNFTSMVNEIENSLPYKAEDDILDCQNALIKRDLELIATPCALKSTHKRTQNKNNSQIIDTNSISINSSFVGGPGYGPGLLYSHGLLTQIKSRKTMNLVQKDFKPTLLDPNLSNPSSIPNLLELEYYDTATGAAIATRENGGLGGLGGGEEEEGEVRSGLSSTSPYGDNTQALSKSNFTVDANNTLTMNSLISVNKQTKSPMMMMGNIQNLSKSIGGDGSNGPNKGNNDPKGKEIDMRYLSKVAVYRDWMLKVNFSFNIIIRQPTQSQNPFTPYKYYVGRGNNSNLIKTLMKQRFWWTPSESIKDPNLNFLWTQAKQNAFLELLKCKKKTPKDNVEGELVSLSSTSSMLAVLAGETSRDKNNEVNGEVNENRNENGVKRNSNICNTIIKKPNPYTNSKSPLNKKKLELDKSSKEAMSNLQKIMNKHDSLVMLTYITNKRKSKLLEHEDELLKINRKEEGMLTIIDQPNNTRMHNHVEGHYHLSNKKAMFYNLKEYFESLKQNVFEHLPLTFHIKNGIDDPEFKKFCEYFHSKQKLIEEEQEKLQEDNKGLKKTRNIWIIKPGENTNRGTGITLCNEINQVKEIISTNEVHHNGNKKTYIVQQYLDKPLLYNKRKFDIRCYMMITSVNKLLKGYWYQDGYIRTSSKEFNLKNITNKMIHLTNDAVQKKSEEYGKYENGNKLSYTEFQRYLDSTFHDRSVNFMNDIYPQMKSLATHSIRSVFGKIDPYRREHTFEIFGLDFMIDQNLKVWLIEINTNPCLELSSSHLARVIPSMVEHALRISLDPIFPLPNYPIARKYNFPENLLENNKFELVFDEIEDAQALRNILKETNQQSMNQIYEMEEDDTNSLEDEKEEN